MLAPPLVIVNPIAGNGRARRLLPLVRHALPIARVVETDAPGAAEALARAAGADGHSRVVVVGGDGTVQEVANGLLAAPGPAVGIVPAGSGNDLARTLKLPKDASAALTVAVSGVEREIDVGRATDATGRTRHFLSAGGIGFDAQVAAAMAGARRSWQWGAAGYLLTTLNELRRFGNRHLELELGAGERLEAKVLLAAVANGPYYGGGMQICPDASLDDGMLDVCLVGDISRLEAVRQLPGLYRGRHVGHRAVSFRRVSSLIIRDADGQAASRSHLDGEPFGPLPLRVEAVPAALRVVVPGASPAPLR